MPGLEVGFGPEVSKKSTSLGAEVTLLNQLLALKKTVAADHNEVITKGYHAIQSAPRLAGITKTYQPRDDAGEALPGESQRVQVKAAAVTTHVFDAFARLIDLNASLDATNQVAKADIVIEGGLVLARDVPVATLLFLEKQLTDLATFVRKLPLLDQAEAWTPSDTEDGVWTSEPVKTTRSKKVPRNHVKAKPTDKHPEQVEVYYEDVVVGDWTTTKFSGAMSHREAASLLRRVAEVTKAVKTAREAANMATVVDLKPGTPLMTYILGS